MAAHYRLEPDQVERSFSPRGLMELFVAEMEAPWGESAANVRMEYLAAAIGAASQGYEPDSRKAYQSEMARLRLKLYGPQPKKPPLRVADLKRRA